MRLPRLVAVAALAMACMVTPAVAHGRHHHYHHHHHHHHRHHRLRHYRQSRIRPEKPAERGLGIDALVMVARDTLGDTAAQLGVRPTLWCMAAVNHWLHEIGLPGSGSDTAMSALSLGRHVHWPVVGSLAVMGRHGGGHVGVVSGVTPDGDPVIISGNHGNRVGEGVYAARRIIAYVILS